MLPCRWQEKSLVGSLCTLVLALLPGCQHTGPPTAASSMTPAALGAFGPAAAEPAVHLNTGQAADVQVALGQSLEKRGVPEQAMAAYTEALRQDPSRADARVRLAVLYDRQGKFADSDEMYSKALTAQPDNPDLYCNRGYSCYLRHGWTEAEAHLRRAIALAPDHSRAHNNLGLVLAHTGRPDEALDEFRRAGCSEADAHVNLAFALTLERSLQDARRHYEVALNRDPSYAPARKGLQELDGLAAKTAPAPADAAAIQPISLGPPAAN